MSKILTVTIPSYNVEKYLQQTLESFVAEEIMEDLEVLIVNDGSKDKTAEIGEIYEKKYPGTFRLINKENGGHGSTINRGIEEATGRYFKVVDGDDWVKTEDFVKLVKELKSAQAEFVLTNYCEVNDRTGEEKLVSYPMFKKQREWALQEVTDQILIPMHPLVIRTDILKDHQIRMTEHCFYVDNEYTTFPIPYVQKVEYLDLAVYMYRLALVTQSVSIKGFQNHIQDHLKVIQSLLTFMEKCEKTNLDEKRLNYIAERIAVTVSTQVGIFTSFPAGEKKWKQEFIKFDHMLKQVSPRVYRLSDSKSHVLHILRKCNFRFYSFWITLSKIKAKARAY